MSASLLTPGIAEALDCVAAARLLVQQSALVLADAVGRGFVKGTV
ncbi:hypothetical protein [Streptomyces sp. NPDC048565]